MKSNIWTKVVLALGISTLAIPALADENSSAMNATNHWPSMMTSEQFVWDASMGGMKEVLLSRAALQKTTNADIKSFAKRMIKDHTAANKALMKIADNEGLNYPATNTFMADDPNWSNPMITSPETLKGAQLLMMTNVAYAADYRDVKNLQSLNGMEFDRMYVSAMAGDHVKAVNEFEMASQNLSDPKLKKFAEKTLPTLREHSKMARELNDRYHNGSNGSHM